MDGDSRAHSVHAELTSHLNEREAAVTLGLSVKTLRRWRWARKGVAWCKIGGAVRYDPRDVAAFIEGGRNAPSAPDA